MTNRLFGLDMSATRSSLGGIASSRFVVSEVEGMASLEVDSKPNAGVMFRPRAGTRALP
jgi:hypothetical protein